MKMLAVVGGAPVHEARMAYCVASPSKRLQVELIGVGNAVGLKSEVAM